MNFALSQPRPTVSSLVRIHPVDAAVLMVSAIAWASLAEASAVGRHMRFCGHPSLAQLSLRWDAIVSAGALGDLSANWILMVLAMMLPVAMPMIRHVHARSMKVRRGRSAILFASGFLITWFAAGVIAMPMSLLINELLQMMGATALATTVAFASAALFQLSRAKTRALNRCHGTLPLRTYDAAADIDALRFGIIHARRCLASCWPAMGALLLAGHSLTAMLLVTASVVRERRIHRPSGVGSAWLIGAAGTLSLVA